MELAPEVTLDQADHPRAHVARVDHLHRARGIPGRQDVSALGDPLDPVGEAPGVVVRADHVGRAHDRGAVAEAGASCELDGHLERSVGLVGDLGDVVGRRREQRRGLVEADGRGDVVRRHRGHDDIAPGAVAECIRERMHLPGDVGAHVDRRVELQVCERAQVTIAIEVDVGSLGKGVVRTAASMDERDLVTARKRRLDDVSPDEPRAPDDQDPHSRSLLAPRAPMPGVTAVVVVALVPT